MHGRRGSFKSILIHCDGGGDTQTICMAEEVASRASCYTVWLSSYLKKYTKTPKMGHQKAKPTKRSKTARKEAIKNREPKRRAHTDHLHGKRGCFKSTLLHVWMKFFPKKTRLKRPKGGRKKNSQQKEAKQPEKRRNQMPKHSPFAWLKRTLQEHPVKLCG